MTPPLTRDEAERRIADITQQLAGIAWVRSECPARPYCPMCAKDAEIASELRAERDALRATLAQQEQNNG